LQFLFGGCLRRLPRRATTGILPAVSGVLQTLFSTEIFLPRGHEYLWTPRLLELELGSNAIIAIACLVMAAALVRLAVKRAGLGRRAQIALGLFVAFAAATHFLDLWVIWAPRYWLDALVRCAAAIVAVATAFALITNRGDR
jgi:two-component system NtrC family sensor kinase